MKQHATLLDSEKMKEETIIEVNHLKKYFPIKLGFFRSLRVKEAPYVHAVDDISFQIKAGEIFGLAGESGCGKTTTGRLLLRLVDPTTGEILFKGIDISKLPEGVMRRLRRKMQIIFQDPYASLNPRMSIYDIIAEPIQLLKTVEKGEKIINMVSETLEDVDLIPPEEFLFRFPHEVSGGQRQRIAIARAFVLKPEFIVADEPVSMLDASIRSEVLRLMLGMVEKTHCAFLYITHDIALTRYMCNRLAIMYLGKIVEMGETEDVIQKPAHPYTEALIAAVPVPDPTSKRGEVVIKGEVPSALNPPPGCRFHTRCPYAQELCKKQEPKLVETGKKFVACHFPLN